MAKLLAWRHPGFSAHLGERITPEDEQCIEDAAAYLVRNPLSLEKLAYHDGQQALLYPSRMNPSLGRSFEAMDPLEWLARTSDRESELLLAGIEDGPRGGARSRCDDLQGV